MSQGSYANLLGDKLRVLKRLHENIQVDEGNIEECIGAIDSNESFFTELMLIESHLEQISPEVTAETSKILEETFSFLLKIKEGTSRLAKTIQNDREISAKAIGQFSKRREIANSYMKLEQRSVFVDKDFK